MQCCGYSQIEEITTMEDRAPVFLCRLCGKQGGQSAFPDEVPEAQPVSKIEQIRYTLAGWLARAADSIAPRY